MIPEDARVSVIRIMRSQKFQRSIIMDEFSNLKPTVGF